MRHRRARSRAALVTVLLVVVPAWPGRAAAAPPPVDAFAALPPILDVQLAPNGRRAVLLRAIGETYHAVMADFDSATMHPLLAADPDTFLFNWCRWANDERVVCSIRRYDTLRRSYETLRGVAPLRYWYQGHQGGRDGPQHVNRYDDGRMVFTRLLAVNADGSGQLQLIPEAKPPRGGGALKWNDPVQDTVVSWLPGDPEHILVQLRRDDPDAPTVFRLNVYDNRLTTVRSPHGAVQHWFANRAGELVLATGTRAGALVAFAVHDNRLQPLSLERQTDRRAAKVAAVDVSGRGAYLFTSHGRDTRGLYRLNLRTGTVLDSVVVDPEHDVDGGRLLLHPTTGRPVLFSYHGDRPMTQWFDEALEREIDAVRRALPGRPDHIRIVSSDAGMRRLVLATQGNGTRPRVYLYDRLTPDGLVLLGEAYAGLRQVVESEPVVYPTRDGVAVAAYLTVPPDRPPKRRLPTVLLPHDGAWPGELVDGWAGHRLPAATAPRGMPRLRAMHSVDVWTQFLVSRGYAVLQPMSRGALGGWGDGLPDGLIDGLDWLVERGVTDPQRVCIVGGAYGGYAALVAAFEAPARFRCAVSFAGVADLDALARRWRGRPGGAAAVDRLPTGADLRARSPLHQVGRIAVPLLIVHGEADYSVPVDQSRALVQALASAGKTYTYIEQPGGDHFVSRRSQRAELMAAMDAFLRTHLGGSGSGERSH